MQKMTVAPKAAGTRVFKDKAELLMSEIEHAIPQVQPDDLCVDGKPKVEALEALVGEQITEAQRDQACKNVEAAAKAEAARVKAEAKSKEKPAEPKVESEGES